MLRVPGPSVLLKHDETIGGDEVRVRAEHDNQERGFGGRLLCLTTRSTQLEDTTATAF